LKIVHAASELYPYVKTGGLADAVGALTGTLADLGHDVSVIVPGYRAALAHPDAAKAERKLRLKIEMDDSVMSGEVRVFSPRPRVTVHLVCRDEYFDRSHPYGTGERDYEDNADRFIFFAKAVVETLRQLNYAPDIVHGHDWQAALIPLLLRQAELRHGTTLAVKTLFTIHNIAYQGLFPPTVFRRLNLPDELFGIDGLEYYGQVNLMKGGLLFADRVTTVSPHYAEEIQTAEFGCGLEGVVQTRGDDIVGLINGIDTAVWNPSVDPFLPAKFSASDLAGKAACRRVLLETAGMPADFTGAVFGMVCRLVEQKGMELVLAARSYFERENCRLIILGSGEKRYEDALRSWAAAAPDRLFLCARLDEKMSHLIEAGADFFLMPSLFEPCGLNQMYSQAYGTVPVVSRVGGLVDTVVDVDDDPEHGTGLMCAPRADSFRSALDRSARLFAAPQRYQAAQKRGMNRDFGWKQAVRAYERLYQDAL
jgi:starch synthase